MGGEKIALKCRSDYIRTNPKVKPQTEPIQTENRIWFTFLLNREPQNREPLKPH
jgi:hypothetical protein